MRAAVHYCVTQGRNGLGIPIFWAAGNGNESVSNDGYASNPEVMAVAASSNNPDTGISHPANDHDYTDDFGGTSSATPLAAGITVLLSINPNLRVEDVKQILRDTADKIDPSKPASRLPD
ncbi:Calcium-dependent protease precursor [Methanosarcina mazei Tuc01]|uniref:Calcium-dependent protease n=1 Tax=Methanosarcina mazei Tuc01 TaxID=1236903 RepID=M1QDS9_METMZ|nr:S8 family serine peptidase [Methanosarcina mazei]AGF98398.1 Calcium-dependent protease precursor [Methanosarcina mazei Tuc01]